MNEDIEYLKSIAYKLGTVGAEQLSEKDGTKMLNAIMNCMSEQYKQGAQDAADTIIKALEPELKDSELYKQVKEVFK